MVAKEDRSQTAAARIVGGDLHAISVTRLLLLEILEPLTRIGGWLFNAFGKDRVGVEAAVRGRILGGKRRWRIGRGVQFVGPARRIRLGRGVSLYGNTVVNSNGPAGFVEIGHDTHIDHHSLLYGQGGLSIGSRCALAAGTLIYSQTNIDLLHDGTPVVLQPIRYAPVIIEDACWFGAGVRVLPGIRVSRGAQIGAGTVLLHDVPPHSVIVGVPGRLVRSYLDSDARPGATTPPVDDA